METRVREIRQSHVQWGKEVAVSSGLIKPIPRGTRGRRSPPTYSRQASPLEDKAMETPEVGSEQTGHSNWTERLRE